VDAGLGRHLRVAAALGGEAAVERVEHFSHGHAEAFDVGLAQIDKIHLTPPA